MNVQKSNDQTAISINVRRKNRRRKLDGPVIYIGGQLQKYFYQTCTSQNAEVKLYQRIISYRYKTRVHSSDPSLNLWILYSKLKNAEFHNNSKITVRLVKPKVTILLFSTGRLIISCTKGKAEAKQALLMFKKMFRRSVGDQLCLAELKLTYLLVCVKYGRQIDLFKLASCLLPERVRYNPDLYSFLKFDYYSTIELRENERSAKFTAMVYNSGNVTIFVREREDFVDDAVERFKLTLDRIFPESEAVNDS